MSADTRDPQRHSFSMPAFAEWLRVFIQSQSASDRTGGTVRLLARSSEQHVQGIADDLCDRTVVCEHDVRHAREIIIEEQRKHTGFERLREHGEIGNVGEKCRDLAALPAEINRIGIAGKPLRQVRREVTRKRRMCPLGLRLAPPRIAQDFDVPDGLVDGRFEIEEIDRFGQEIERAAVHRDTNIGNVAIGRDDDGRELFFVLLQLLKQR